MSTPFLRQEIKMPALQKEPSVQKRIASTTFSVVQDSLKTDANSGTSFSLISKDLGYINSMIKRHFSDFAWGKLKNQNKGSSAFHVARCSPLHNSKPKCELSIKCTPKHGGVPDLQLYMLQKTKASLYLMSYLVLYWKWNQTYLVLWNLKASEV